jgi:hypothetical protein
MVTAIAGFLAGCWLTIGVVEQDDKGSMMLFAIGLTLASIVFGIFLFAAGMVPLISQGIN